MTQSTLTDLRGMIEREERHAAHSDELRGKYGQRAIGRTILEHYASVEADEKHLVAGIKKAAERSDREIHLLIDGAGGLSSSLERIVEALEGFKGMTRGIVLGRCPSASVHVLAACDERIAVPHASFMVHSCGFYQGDSRYPYTPPRYTARSLDKEAARLAERDIKGAAYLRRRTGSRILAEMDSDGEDHHLTAAEARSHGLVTKIEPAEPSKRTGFSMSSMFRPRVAHANRMVADMAWKTGAYGTSFVSVRIHGEISKVRGVTAASVRKQLDSAPHAKSILVHFNSIGGNLDEAAKIYGALREHPARRKEAIVRNCQSAAILPLLACDVRTAKPVATILLHTAAMSPWEHRDYRWTAAKHQRVAEAITAADDMVLDVLAERTGWDREWFAERMREDKPISLGDALKVGLIHSIDGVTRAPDPSWPAKHAQLALTTGVVMGIPSYLSSEAYLHACRCMGKDRA